MSLIFVQSKSAEAVSPRTLSPTQQRAYEEVKSDLSRFPIGVLKGGTGVGKTTVLEKLHAELGGAFLTVTDLSEALLKSPHPLSLEETFYRLVRAALLEHKTVILDDLHLLYTVTCGCGGFSVYPRKDLFEVPLSALLTLAETQKKQLIFGSGGNMPNGLRSYAFQVGIAEFTPEDYAHFCRQYLPKEAAGRLDYARIHRFAPKMSVIHLRSACIGIESPETVETERFIDYLRSLEMSSNVDLGEVQAVDLTALKGMDDMLEALEANIIVPLENDELAKELDIKPKRGVLLAGPPGTGKTTVGRALAHRLKSKFFLIDGTVIAGTQGFYQRIQQIFEAAKQNAPAIIFIDDSDVIFESGQEFGLYRYLLTMMDGLESASAGRVCVIMTAMNIGNLPPALLRSGRIELWLETRLPDAEARTEILTQSLAKLPEPFAGTDISRLVADTDEMTGADLKRLVEDGKLLLAYDKSRNLPLQNPTEYFLRAVETVRANKEKYAQADAYARTRQDARPSYFDLAAMMGAMDGAE